MVLFSKITRVPQLQDKRPQYRLELGYIPTVTALKCVVSASLVTKDQGPSLICVRCGIFAALPPSIPCVPLTTHPRPNPIVRRQPILVYKPRWNPRLSTSPTSSTTTPPLLASPSASRWPTSAGQAARQISLPFPASSQDESAITVVGPAIPNSSSSCRRSS